MRAPSSETPPAGVYQRELEVARGAALAAGEVLRDFRRRSLEVREKQDGSLVTDADLASEAEILRLLRQAFPGDAVLAEESGEAGDPAGRLWIVDPLDGTTNFSRGLPFFAVSIALWEGGRPVVGIVFLPVLDELFLAGVGEPATLNGHEIRVSETDTVRKSMINVYFDRHQLLEPGLDLLARVARACEGRIKNLGSTASMLCYVAAGRLDAYVRNTTKKWDFAAGSLIVQQAGGCVSDFRCESLRESGQSLLATNGRIHQELAELAAGT